MKKVVRNIIFSVLTLYLSIACKNYTADIDEYLSYWTTEASIAGYVFNTATQTDAEGALCVSSKDPVTITFTVRNPKNFDFKMPGESDAPADIITFPHLQNAADVSALQAGDDYVFKKISGSTLELTYTPAFLRKHEWSSGNIAPAIMLYTNDGRVFKQTITLELKVNTPPPTIKYYAVAKTSAAVPGEDAYYVLCLQVPDMDTKITGGLLHKDIAGIEINGIRYPLSIDEEQQGFVKPENDAFLDITDVVPLDEHDAADIPSGWVLYFKTDAAVKTGSAKKDYTVKLTDTNGFTSSELKASTSPNKLPKEEWKVTKGDPAGEKSGTAAEPIIIGADSDGAAVSVSSKIPNTVVHCTLTEIGQEAEPEQTGIVSVTVDMPLKGKNEKTYKLEYYTDGEGFAATAPQTVYYNILLKHTVTFNLAGGNIGGKTDAITMTGTPGTPFTQPADPAKDGYNFSGWLPSLPSSPVFPKADTEYTAQWTKDGNTPYKIEHYQQNIDDDDYTLVSADTQSLKGEAEALIAVARKHYEGFTFDHQEPSAPTIAATGDTVVRVYYNRKEITLTFRLNGGTIGGSHSPVIKSGKFGKPFTPPSDMVKDGYTFDKWKPVPPATELFPSPVFPAENAEYTAQWKEISKPNMCIKEGFSAGKKSYGESSTEDLVPDAGTYTQTSPLVVYKDDGQAKLLLTVPSGTQAYHQIDEGGKIQGTEIMLSNDGNVHKLTVWIKEDNTDGVKTVLYIHVKDALTTYKELKNVVKHADESAVINIGNNLNCTEESSEIEINKAVTIQRKSSSGNSRYTLDANEKGRFFKITSGGTLTLKNIILKNGKAGGDILTNLGGGIHVLNGGMCQLTNCIITECKAMGGGALAIAGNCTLTDSIVENNSFLAGGSAAAANILFTGRFVVEGSSVIKDNKTADGSADAAAIMVTGGITLKDSAKVGAGNNIHLSVASACITVDGNLEALPTAAGVSMPAFSAGRKVLKGSLTSDNIGKFTLVGFHADQWKINASGELEAVGGQSPVVTVSNWEALRTAVQNASDGTVIEIAKNLTYNIAAAGSNKSTITVNKNITIKSKKSKDSNPYTLNADCTGTFPTYASKVKSIFEVSGGKTLTLENVTLSNAKQYAVSVAENCSLMMTKVTIKDCTTTQDNAAGIYFNKGKNLTLTGCTIEKCKGTGSASSGGIYIQEPTGTVSIKNTKIEECEGSGTGGGIYLYKAAGTLENVKVDRCSAKSGGGIYVKGGTLTITGGFFINNSAGGDNTSGGGAIYSEGAKVTITGCTIGDDDSNKGNYAGQGGGIFVNGGAECILEAGTKIIGNSAIGLGTGTGNGGGIFVDKVSKLGKLTIKGSKEKPVVIAKNTADYGGGLYHYGNADIKYAEIKENTVPHDGGGMYNAGICMMVGVELKSNKAENEGGGIYSNATLALNDTIVTGNEAASGGAVQIAIGSSTFQMSGSTVITIDSSKNDVYVTNDAFITLTGALTATEKIARITLNGSGGYKNNREIVKGGSGFTIPSGYENKFTITDKIGSQPHWKLIYQSNALKLKQN